MQQKDLQIGKDVSPLDVCAVYEEVGGSSEASFTLAKNPSYSSVMH